MTELRPTRQIGEENVEGSNRNLVLPYDHVDNLTLGDPVPSVRDRTRFRANANGTITEFKHGAQGQIIHILGDGVTIVQHNSVIRRDGGVSGVLVAEKVYTFEFIKTPTDDGIWYEGGAGIATSVAVVSANLSALSNALSAEIANRVSADNVILIAVNVVSNAVSVESADRASVDDLLSNALSVLSSRLSAVSAMSVGGISVEGLQSVVNALSNRISGIVAGTNDPATDTKVWMPLHTVSAGVPKLVWSGLDELIPTLIPVGP